MRLSDKITHDADWRDGINAFRLRTREEIEELRAEINKLKQQIKEIPQ